jgi:hypothetical protein
MRGAIPSLPLHAFMAWCSVKAQGQLTVSKRDFASLAGLGVHLVQVQK